CGTSCPPARHRVRSPGTARTPWEGPLMLRSSLLLIALFLGMAVGAGGQTKGEPQKKPIPPKLAELLKVGADEFLKRHDKNKDGYLSKDEAPPFLVPIFEKVDANGDGKIDRKELEAAIPFLRQRFNVGAKGPDAKEVERLVDKLLAQMDTDKDGKISKSEA